jgi:hypothetical protein
MKGCLKILVFIGVVAYILIFPDAAPGPVDDIIVAAIGWLVNKKVLK